MYLGVTFGWGIPMAFAAQLETVPRVAWLLLLANVLWVTVYDTMYAMVDRDDDIKIGVTLDRDSVRRLGSTHHRGAAGHDAARPVSRRRQTAYGLLVLRWASWRGAIFFIYQLWLIRARDREACFRAFLNNNYFGMSVFLGILLAYQFAGR